MARKSKNTDACGCGQPHLTRHGKPSCTSHSGGRLRPEIAGKPCRMYPVPGSTVCKNHGGKAPQVKAKAAENAARAEAAEQQRKLAATLGDLDPADHRDPGEIVAEQIAWRYRHVQWLRARMQAITPETLVWGVTRETANDVVVGNGPKAHLDNAAGTTSEAKPNVWLQLYLEASAALEKLCIDAIRVGLEERRVRLAEQDAELWVRMIDGVLTDLGHDPNAPETAEVVERHLRSAA